MHPICLILVVIPMHKKPPRITLNHFGSKEKEGEKLRACVSVAVSIQTV